LDFLIVCTANQCRSPMGEVLLRRVLESRQLPARVGSAGFLESGAPAMPPAIETMADEGLDLSGHVSRQLDPPMVDQADLIVTMTRQHVIQLAVMAPEAWPRVYQLTDLVRRAESVGRRAPEQPFADWLALVGAGRTRSGLLADKLSDDIDDPVGGPRSAYDRTKVILDDQLSRLARLL